MQAVAGEQDKLEKLFNLQAITDMHDRHVQEQYRAYKSDYADPAEDKHLRTEKEYQKYLPQYAPEVDSRIVGLGTKELKDIIERAGKLDLTFAADDGLLDKYSISEKTQGKQGVSARKSFRNNSKYQLCRLEVSILPCRNYPLKMYYSSGGRQFGKS